MMVSDARKVIDVTLGRYLSGGTDESLYLNSFSSDSVNILRKNGTNVQLSHPLLNILWAIQNDKFHSSISNRLLLSGGFWSRFLIACINDNPQEISLV